MKQITLFDKKTLVFRSIYYKVRITTVFGSWE